MYRLDSGLNQLIETGRQQGFLTFSQVNAYLPDEAMNPDKLDNLLQSLDELGMHIVADEKLPMTPEFLLKRRTTKVKPMKTDREDKSRKIDDPVRMYLTQMGEIPLLTREQEISLAKKIEITRKRFRRHLLESDYALKQSIDILKKVSVGELPFDRTIKVSVTEGLEKNQILGRMPHNLRTLELLRDKSIADFEIVIAPGTPAAEVKAAQSRLASRSRKMVTLLEELSLRTQRLQPTMRRLEQISNRMDHLQHQIDSMRNLKSARDERANLQKELHIG